jgi:hypothetical protein
LTIDKGSLATFLRLAWTNAVERAASFKPLAVGGYDFVSILFNWQLTSAIDEVRAALHM